MAALQQPDVAVSYKTINAVPKHLTCSVCKLMMNNPVQLQTCEKMNTIRVTILKVIMTGCRECIIPYETAYDNTRIVSLPEVAKELDMITVVCLRCKDTMWHLKSDIHRKTCKLMLVNCYICRELYPSADKAIHDATDCHVRAVLKKKLAEDKLVKHRRADADELPPAKRRQLVIRAPAAVAASVSDEQKDDSESNIILDAALPLPQPLSQPQQQL
jgi:hypothetical protein